MKKKALSPKARPGNTNKLGKTKSEKGGIIPRQVSLTPEADAIRKKLPRGEFSRLVNEMLLAIKPARKKAE